MKVLDLQGRNRKIFFGTNENSKKFFRNYLTFKWLQFLKYYVTQGMVVWIVEFSSGVYKIGNIFA